MEPGPLAVLGTGRMGRALSGALARAGLPVVVGSRQPERAQALCAQLAAQAPGAALGWGDLAQASARARAIIPAVGYAELLALAGALGPAWAGKLVVDLSTPWGQEVPATSASEELRRRLPLDTALVGAWKSTYAALLEQGPAPLPVRDVFLCGDDPSAKDLVSGWVRATGFRPVDCGPLPAARTLEAMVRLMGELPGRLGLPPGTAPDWKLLP